MTIDRLVRNGLVCVLALATGCTNGGRAATQASPLPSASPTSSAPSPTPTTTSPTPAPSPTTVATWQPISVAARGPYGLRLRVRLDRAPATGVPTSLAVDANDDDGAIDTCTPDWGDHSDDYLAHSCQPRVMVQCVFRPSPIPHSPAPDRRQATLSHTWRQPGEYLVTVEVLSHASCSDILPERATALFRVHVRRASTLSNGPARPAAELEFVHNDAGTSPLVVRLSTDAVDEDGRVRTAAIDWGDGSPREVVRNDSTCDDGNGMHYPSHGSLSVDRKHAYRTAGTYTIRLSFSSAGCTGRDVQYGGTRATTKVPVPGA